MNRDTQHARPLQWRQPREYRRLFAGQSEITAGAPSLSVDLTTSPINFIRSPIHIRANVNLLHADTNERRYSLDTFLHLSPSNALIARTMLARQGPGATNDHTTSEMTLTDDQSSFENSIYLHDNFRLWISTSNSYDGSKYNRVTGVGVRFDGTLHAPAPSNRNLAQLIVDEPCRPI